MALADYKDYATEWTEPGTRLVTAAHKTMKEADIIVVEAMLLKGLTLSREKGTPIVARELAGLIGRQNTFGEADIEPRVLAAAKMLMEAPNGR